MEQSNGEIRGSFTPFRMTTSKGDGDVKRGGVKRDYYDVKARATKRKGKGDGS
jgi:hypothetical protein